jgi:hypothetical protein
MTRWASCSRLEQSQCPESWPENFSGSRLTFARQNRAVSQRRERPDQSTDFPAGVCVPEDSQIAGETACTP